MRVTTRLRITSTATIAAFIILAPVLVWSFAEFRNAKSNYVLADTIRVNFFERASFRDQYFLYREDRARVLWEESKEEAFRLLRQADTQFHVPEDRQILERLHKNIEDSAAIFHRIVENTGKLNSAAGNRRVYEELDKRLYSQLLLKANAVRDTSTALQEASAQRVELTYKRLTIIIGLFAVTLALASILTSMHLGRLIRKRLAPLHDGAKIVADGNIDYRIRSGGGDEFGELALSINAMTDKLAAEIREHAQLENALRDSEEKLQAILNAAEVAIAWANEKGVIEYVNPKFTSLFGYTLDDVPSIEQWYLHAYPDAAYRAKSVAEWNTRIARSLPEKTPLEPMELDIACKDGSMRHVLLMGSWAGARLLANFSDITERKAAEEALQASERRYRFLFDNNPMPMWVFDEKSLRFLEVNERAIEHYGYTRKEFSRMTLRDIRPKEDVAILDRTIVGSPSGKLVGEFRHQKKDGTIINVSINTEPMTYGDTRARIALIQDITERKAAEDKLFRSEANLRAILDNSPYLVWLKDMEGRFIAVNHAFFNTTGLEKIQDVLGKTDFDLWPETLAKKYRADDAEVLSTRKQKLTEEMSMDNGEVRWVETFKAPIMDMDGNLLGTTGFAQDISVRKNAEVQIRHLAHYDPLTDLPNRTLFSDRLQQALAAAKRNQSHLALMFLDLDKFKPINDTLGHHVGDLLLKEVASRMQDCVRESDTVARIGGDEFVVLLPNVESGADAVRVAEKIRLTLNQPFNLVGQSLHISSSSGIALYPEHGTDETQLVKNADVAMYHAKEGGRDNVMLYRTEMANE